MPKTKQEIRRKKSVLEHAAQLRSRAFCTFQPQLRPPQFLTPRVPRDRYADNEST